MYKRQIRKLYLAAVFESFALGNAAWVALLAQRGYSIGQIGILEAIFHVVSLSGEIPSGVMADVLGRKKVMILSRIMSVLSALAGYDTEPDHVCAVCAGDDLFTFLLGYRHCSRDQCSKL